MGLWWEELCSCDGKTGVIGRWWLDRKSHGVVVVGRVIDW